MADELGITIGEVWDMMGSSTVEMTKGLSAAVWKNAHKQVGFAERGGRGTRRFWACMHMFQEEGLVVDKDGGLEGRDRDLSWDGMAEEMARMLGIGTQQPEEQGEADQPPTPEGPGTEAGAGVGQTMTMGPEEGVGGDDTTEQGSEEEGGDMPGGEEETLRG